MAQVMTVQIVGIIVAGFGLLSRQTLAEMSYFDLCDSIAFFN